MLSREEHRWDMPGYWGAEPSPRFLGVSGGLMKFTEQVQRWDFSFVESPGPGTEEASSHPIGPVSSSDLYLFLNILEQSKF